MLLEWRRLFHLFHYLSMLASKYRHWFATMGIAMTWCCHYKYCMYENIIRTSIQRQHGQECQYMFLQMKKVGFKPCNMLVKAEGMWQRHADMVVYSMQLIQPVTLYLMAMVYGDTQKQQPHSETAFCVKHKWSHNKKRQYKT